jgi:phage terminase Nu1 subunit (DNA packaging protein)
MIDPGSLTQRQLAEVIGVTTRHIQSLEKQGIDLGRSEKCLYVLRDSVKKWIDYKLRLAEKKQQRQPPGDLDELRAEKIAEDISLTREKRIAQEMENAKTAGGLYEVDKADLEFADAIKGIVTLLATLPDRLERDCHISPDAVTRVQTEVDALRDRLWRRFALDADG